MSIFPSVQIIDTFEGSDEEPISEGGLWSSSPLVSGFGLVRRLGGEAAGASASTDSYGVRTDVSIADTENCDCWLTIGVLPGNGIAVFCRVQNPGAAGATAYELAQVGTVLRLYLLHDGTAFTQLGADIEQTVSAGDSIGLRVNGSTLTAYYKPSGGAWRSVGSITDATITGDGGIGFEINDPSGNARVTEFGGGLGISHDPPPSQHDLSEDSYVQALTAGYSDEMASKIKTRLQRNG